MVSIEGMTCNSCVRSIEGRISDVDGVVEIKVSLEEKVGRICYSPARVSPEALRDAIDDMGFEASLEDTAVSLTSTTIHVDGMTCNSCVCSIEGRISAFDGVDKISVSLDRKEAVIDFDPRETTAQKLREGIEDMGFDATLPSSFALIDFGSNMQTVTLGVKGMTCNSCVRNIEGTISSRPGVSDIKVSLQGENATITYNPSETNPETLRDAVDDMGFECFIPTPECNRKKASEIVVINIQGMMSDSCVGSIEGTVGEKGGVKIIKVSLADNSGTVEYDPSLVTSSQLVEAIDDMGFEASLQGT